MTPLPEFRGSYDPATPLTDFVFSSIEAEFCVTDFVSLLRELEFPLTDVESPLKELESFLFWLEFPLIEAEFPLMDVVMLPSFSSSMNFISRNYDWRKSCFLCKRGKVLTFNDIWKLTSVKRLLEPLLIAGDCIWRGKQEKGFWHPQNYLERKTRKRFLTSTKLYLERKTGKKGFWHPQNYLWFPHWSPSFQYPPHFPPFKTQSYILDDDHQEPTDW